MRNLRVRWLFASIILWSKIDKGWPGVGLFGVLRYLFSTSVEDFRRWHLGWREADRRSSAALWRAFDRWERKHRSTSGHGVPPNRGPPGRFTRGTTGIG